jgi:hypothetical protein
MAQGKLPEATKLLPRTFREVYNHPKISEQVTAIGEVAVKAMIEFQLARLASLMTTGGNLNDTLTDFISSQLMEMYPYESIADIRLCLERGAMGRYGEIQRMDGVTIGTWMGMYLDEKYNELESKITERKANDVTKQPIEGLEEAYMKMKDQSKADYDKRQFEKDELSRMFKKSLPVDMEALESRDVEAQTP